MRSLLLAFLLLSVNGCALFAPVRSSVSSSLSPTEATQIARDVGGYLGEALPAAQTVVAMERPRFARLNDDFGPVLAQVLRMSGFAVLESETELPAARRLSYVVSAWEDGVSMRVRLDQYVISRWYMRTADGLVPASPFSVKAGATHVR